MRSKKRNNVSIRRIGIDEARIKDKTPIKASKIVPISKEELEEITAVKRTPLSEEDLKKVKRTISITAFNDTKIEKLSHKIGLPKSKIIDILVSKMVMLDIENEFDLYNLEVNLKK